MKNFVVYKSSAGSGKTFTLVKEYLRLSLADEKKLGSAYRRILAVTFTNKAAAEMKSRVVEALHGISSENRMPAIGEMLVRELGVSEAELKRRAVVVLGSILHHYSDFSIGTIDSFTHKIVKTFAHDLKLPVNFTVELDIQGFYDKVISQLLSQVGEDEFVSKLLKEYVLTRAEDNSSWDPENQIREFARLLQKEESAGYIALLQKFNSAQLSEFRQQFVDFVQYYKSSLTSLGKQAVELIKASGLTDEDFNYKKSGPQNFFRKCLSGEATLADAEGARITEAIRNDKWAGKTSPEAEHKLRQILPQLNHLASELVGFIRTHYKYFSLCSLLSKQMYPLMLLKKIEEISIQQKQEDRLVFISEFNQKIFDIVNNEPTPFIYERLGERYQHYLLDEFQDTSSLQWFNILPLLDNSLANGWFNLIVGDGKQSIYRWRNANVRQFAGLPKIGNADEGTVSAGRAATLARNFNEQVLSVNYRSLKKIVEFNNAIFGDLSSKLLKEELQLIYKDQQQTAIGTDAGYITVHTGKTEKDNVDEQTWSVILRQIGHALEKGFSYRDICILCRKNYHGNNIAAFLVQNRVPVVSSDSLLLKNNAEINTIVAYLKYLGNRRDHISAATVVNYLYQTERISHLQLHDFLSQLSSGTSLFRILKSSGISMDDDRPELNNLFDNCVAIIRALGMDERAFHYVRFFLDEVNEFMVMRNGASSFFFEWWEARAEKASMIIPDTTDAVRIMTIHASKGLEFPVVIVPYCNWAVYRPGDSWVRIEDEKVALPVSVVNLSKKASDSGFGKELETEEQEQTLDNLNLLYVAFTRAIERLHIITASSQTSRGITVADWIEGYLQQHHNAAEGVYELGAPSEKLSRAREKLPGTFPLLPLRFETDASAIRIKASYLYNHPEVENARLQGLLIHQLMSAIRGEADVDKALHAALMSGILPPDEQATVRDKILRIIRHEQLFMYFREGVSSRQEAELINADGEVLRPDRIVLLENETVIIDYKTGVENNLKYFRQLHNYAQALSSMGYQNIKKLLVYVDEPLVVAVN